MADKDFKVKSGLDLSVPLPVSMGGTGQTSTNNTLNSLLPAQAGNTSKFLQTNGTNVSWIEAAPLASPTFTGNVVLPSTTTYSGTNIQTSLDAKSNKTKPLSTKIADYTLTTSDNDTLIEFNSSSDLNLTLPTYSNAAFSYGDNFSIVNRGSGKVNILNQSGTTSLSSYSTSGAGSATTYNIVFGNNLWLGQFSLTYYKSTDGITWTSTSQSSGGGVGSNLYNRSNFANGVFILGGSTLRRSTDLSTFTTVLSTGDTWTAPTYKNGTWLVSAQNTAKIARSTDNGQNWTVYSSPAGLTTQAIYSLEYIDSNSTWYGFTGSAGTFIRSTDDGITWVSVSTTGYPGNNLGYTSVIGSKLIVGHVSSTSYYTSIDGGATWTLGFPSFRYSKMLKEDGFLSMAAYTSANGLSFYTSTDGTTWSRQSSISSTNSTYWAIGKHTNGQYIIGSAANTLYTTGSITTSYISKNNSSYILPKGRAEIYNYNQNQFVVSGDLGIDNSVSSNITLVSGNNYYVDTTAARTLTLPASPSVGDQIEIFDASGTAGTYNITLNRNNKLINGNAGNFIIDVNGGWYTLVFTGNTYGWKVA